MSPAHKLTMGAITLAGAIGYLAFLGAASSWQYYLSVDETVADRSQLLGKRIRVSGHIAAGTLRITEDRRQAMFELHGDRHRLQAACRCALPDNLAENIEVVVEGTLHDEGIHGHKVITRCASKYESKEMDMARDELANQPPKSGSPSSTFQR